MPPATWVLVFYYCAMGKLPQVASGEEFCAAGLSLENGISSKRWGEKGEGDCCCWGRRGNGSSRGWSEVRGDEGRRIAWVFKMNNSGCFKAIICFE